MASKAATIAKVEKTSDAVTWNFVKPGLEPITLPLNSLNAEIMGKLLTFGLVTKVGNVKTRLDKDMDDDERAVAAHELMQDMVAQLVAGEWRGERSGSGGPTQDIRDLAEATIQHRAAKGLGGTVEAATTVFWRKAQEAAETMDSPDGRTDDETGDPIQVPTENAKRAKAELDSYKASVAVELAKIRADRARKRASAKAAKSGGGVDDLDLG